MRRTIRKTRMEVFRGACRTFIHHEAVLTAAGFRGPDLITRLRTSGYDYDRPAAALFLAGRSSGRRSRWQW